MAPEKEMRIRLAPSLPPASSRQDCRSRAQRNTNRCHSFSPPPLSPSSPGRAPARALRCASPSHTHQPRQRITAPAAAERGALARSRDYFPNRPPPPAASTWGLSPRNKTTAYLLWREGGGGEEKQIFSSYWWGRGETRNARDSKFPNLSGNGTATHHGKEGTAEGFRIVYSNHLQEWDGLAEADPMQKQ